MPVSGGAFVRARPSTLKDVAVTVRTLQKTSGPFRVRLEQLWPFLDLFVVAAGFYVSESSPKAFPIRSEIVRGLVFGRVAEKCQGL